MPLALVRIDNRLIHGQVSAAWTAAVSADVILVVNDETARDEVQRMLLPMVAPAGCKVEVLSTVDASVRLKSDAYDRHNVLLVTKTPADVKALVDAGVEISKVNVGNMHFAPGKIQVAQSVSVDPSDVEVFRELDAKGIEIEMQWLPTTRGRPLMQLIDGISFRP